jgi:hypothetical protein
MGDMSIDPVNFDRLATTGSGEPAEDVPSPARRSGWVTGLAALAVVGWGLAGYVYFVELPKARIHTRTAMTLEMVDRFYDSPAEKAYERLGEALKPWFAAIEDMQRKIMAARSDDEKLPLIQKRDQMLIEFIREHGLSGDVDQIVASFDQFTRCISADLCDSDVLRGTIGPDVRRLYRTFKPWIQSRRDGGEGDYGRPLEDLFFRFIG